MNLKVYSILLVMTSVFLSMYTGKVAESVEVTADTIEKAIIEHLKDYAVESGLDIEIEIPNINTVNIQGTDDFEMNIEIPEEQSIKSRIPVRVEFTDRDGAVLRRYQYSARIKIFKIVAVANTDMGHGEQITEDCVDMERVDVSNLKGCFEDVTILGTMQTSRIIKEGTVFTERNVSTIPVISRGERVLIEVKVGSVTATAEGTARQDGGIGDTIRVYNDMTRTTLECRILDEKRVAIGF